MHDLVKSGKNDKDELLLVVPRDKNMIDAPRCLPHGTVQYNHLDFA